MIGPKSAPEIGAYGIGFAADIDGVAHNLYIKRYLFEFEAEKKRSDVCTECEFTFSNTRSKI